jgi:putative aminopeptidase
VIVSRKTVALVLVGLFITLVSIAAPQQRADKMDSFTILKELIEVPGVSGFEEPVRQKVRAHLPAWTKPELDSKGNLSVTFGSGTEHLFFVGHLDEVGYVVTRINDDGTLSVERRGGFYDKYYEARPVMIYTNSGPLSGIITPRLDYYQLPGGDDTYDVRDVRVYLGTETKKETEALGIKTGDSITVPKRFVLLSGDRATARSFDDRSGCTAMLLALMRLDPAKVKKKVTFVWTVEEEVGLNGARALAEKSEADYVFAVDTFVSSDSPREDQRFADAPLGRGFVIRALDTSGVTPPVMVNRVVEIARRHNIPVQTGTTNGGNDGSTFTRYGAINIPLSWPGRYSHSPIEVLDRTDLDALTDIIQHLVLEF